MLITHSFTHIDPVVQQDLMNAGFHPVYQGGRFHVTAPWTHHRDGEGWTFMLPQSKVYPHGLHLYETQEGILQHG